MSTTLEPMKLLNRTPNNKKSARSAKALSSSKSQKASRKITFEGLRKFNTAMAALHLIQGILIVVLSDKFSGMQPVNTSYLTTDKLASEASKAPVLVNASHHLFDIKLAYLVAAFFLMSALAHFLVATRYRGQYEKGLKEGINKFRWIEYAFSASTMMVGIALLTGIFEFSTLFAIFGLTAIMNLCGLFMERQNQGAKAVNWATYKLGVLAGAIPWLVILFYLLGAVFYGEGGIPGFVYAIYVSLFIFFNLFAVNMFLQYKKKGRWSNYLYGEQAYIILSLVAKSALAWQIFGGALRP